MGIVSSKFNPTTTTLRLMTLKVWLHFVQTIVSRGCTSKPMSYDQYFGIYVDLSAFAMCFDLKGHSLMVSMIMLVKSERQTRSRST